MLVYGGRETVDGVATPPVVEATNTPRSEQPIRVVYYPGEVVSPHVCRAPDVLSPNLDIVGVDQEKHLLELVHHGGRLGREMYQHHR